MLLEERFYYSDNEILLKNLNSHLKLSHEIQSYLEQCLFSQKNTEGMYLIEDLMINTISSCIEEYNHLIYKKIIIKTMTAFFIKNWKDSLQKFFLLELHFAELYGEISCSDQENSIIFFKNKIKQCDTKIKFFKRYPLLGIKLKNTSRKYKQFVNLFLIRFHADQDEIKAFLKIPSKENLSVLIDSISPMSDSHQDGQLTAVVRLTLKDTYKKIVYKPKCHGMDGAMNYFYEWLNNYLRLPLYFPKIMIKKEYFWSEYIPHVAVQTEEEIVNFYTRFGYLLGIAYLLNGNDLHYENLIASGEHPVLVDTECFISPFISNTNDLTSEDSCVSISGLISCLEETTEISALFGIIKFNEPNYTEITANRLMYNDKIISPLNYKKYIIDGFTEIYHLFLKQKKYFLDDENSPLHLFKTVKIRVVFRGTPIYYKLLQGVYYPTVLSSQKSYLEHLSWIKTNQIKGFELDNSELKQLINDDIPIFFCYANEKNLVDSNHQMLPFKFKESGYERLIAHITKNISTLDLQQELCVINNAFEITQLNLSNARLSKKSDKNEENNNILNECSALADKILQNIYQNMKVRKDNFVFWHSISLNSKDKFKLNRTDTSLYEGLAGIGLAFVYGAKIFGRDIYYEALQYIVSYCSAWIKNFKVMDGHLNLGAFDGYCGVMYFLYYVAENFPGLNAQDILMISIEKLKNILIDNEHNILLFDVISGIAGVLAVWHTIKKYIPLSTYRIIVKLLLSKIIHKTSILELPDTFNRGQTSLGFAHGVSGLICSLQAVNVDLNSPLIYHWIESALNYERKFFDINHTNWPILDCNQPSQSNAYDMYSWCHGAVGIGMSRVYIHTLNWNDNIIQYEISLMQKFLTKNFLPKNINLCHGMLGNLELSLLMNQAGWHENKLHLDLINNLVAQIPDDLNMLCEYSTSITTFGLMTGKAGVAYQLMRLSDSMNVPSVLLLK